MTPRGIALDKVGQALEVARNGGDLSRLGLERALKHLGELDETSLEAAQSRLGHLRSRFPEVLPQRSDEAQEFDSQACVIIHEELGLTGRVSGERDFWRWLAIARFHDVVDWRHGEGGFAKEANFGAGSPWDNLFTRLWLRADIGYSPARDEPYDLARRGGGDFWRSHLIRIRYGSCRALSRALIALAYPEKDAPFRSPLTGAERRELAKRVRRLHATVAFELLDERTATAIVEQEVSKMRSAGT